MHVKSENFYEDLPKDVETRFDIPNYKDDRTLLFKDVETKSNTSSCEDDRALTMV